MTLKNEVGENMLFEGCAFTMVVAAQHGEVGFRQHLAEEFQSVVKLMVAQCAGHQLLLVHAQYLELAIEDVEVGRPLEHITSIEIEQVGIQLSEVLKHGCTFHNAALHGALARLAWFELRMGVIGVDDGDHWRIVTRLATGAEADGDAEHEKESEKLIHSGISLVGFSGAKIQRKIENVKKCDEKIIQKVI